MDEERNFLTHCCLMLLSFLCHSPITFFKILVWSKTFFFSSSWSTYFHFWWYFINFCWRKKKKLLKLFLKLYCWKISFIVFIVNFYVSLLSFSCRLQSHKLAINDIYQKKISLFVLQVIFYGHDKIAKCKKKWS